MPWKTRLVGRASEIAELEGERRRAAGGQFCCVLLAGDPGFGKTRLAMEALQRAPRSTIRMSARAYSLGEAAAFGVWAEALESHLGSLSAADVSRLCGGWLDDLASLLRSVACLRGSAPQREPPRSRLLEGLAVLLARQAPVVVVLDDVHLADPSLWEGLHYLARNLPTHRVLVIAAARPVELSEARAASRVLLALEQDGLLHRVNVGPLGEAAVPELAEAVLEDKPPKVLVDWLWQRSRGTPLFALGLLQALIDEGADLTAPQLRSLPEGLADRVASRLELLDEPTLSILRSFRCWGAGSSWRSCWGRHHAPRRSWVPSCKRCAARGL